MRKIYYKAFDRNLQCRGFQYEEGKTYKMQEEPILCRRGFHFCRDLVLTLEYHPASKITENKYAEVKILGDTKFEEPTKHKGVTNEIHIKRVLSDDEVLKLVDSDSNSGNRNSGDRNSGDSNSGDRNSGNRNSGNRNSGNRNSGNRNSGDWNSGNWNSGKWNSGDWNSGNWNSGKWNSCDRSSGYFNTKQPETIRVFNKICKVEDWKKAKKPNFINFELDTDIGYKGSWQKAFNEASEEEIEMLKSLPNFDKSVFEELTGIKIK